MRVEQRSQRTRVCPSRRGLLEQDGVALRQDLIGGFERMRDALAQGPGQIELVPAILLYGLLALAPDRPRGSRAERTNHASEQDAQPAGEGPPFGRARFGFLAVILSHERCLGPRRQAAGRRSAVSVSGNLARETKPVARQ